MIGSSSSIHIQQIRNGERSVSVTAKATINRGIEAYVLVHVPNNSGSRE